MKEKTINHCLKKARENLSSVTDNSQLEAEVLLSYILQKDRVYLYREMDSAINDTLATKYFKIIEERLGGKPVAYITKEKEFFSRKFEVDENVLIPRSETEGLVEIVLNLLSAKSQSVVDLGTGSGNIAISIAKERKDLDVFATDVSNFALRIAKENARKHNVKNITFVQGDWLEPFSGKTFDIIVSNPPYIGLTERQDLSQDVLNEPDISLFGGDDGMDAFKKIVSQAKHHLGRGGWLVLEHGWQQAEKVASLMQRYEFSSIKTEVDLSGLNRYTLGQIKNCY